VLLLCCSTSAALWLSYRLSHNGVTACLAAWVLLLHLFGGYKGRYYFYNDFMPGSLDVAWEAA
jgi:hypothetical protein